MDQGAFGDFSSIGRKYESIRFLGRGSFGTVVLVRIVDSANCVSCCRNAGLLNELRVVKCIDVPPHDEAQHIQALQEIEVLRSLSHPNIIGYFESFLEGARLCIVMEYADGGDLAAAINRRREANQKFYERDAIAIFAQLTLAVQYLHGHRILHRDIKSQNVFLTSVGVVKLGDFGISKVLRASIPCAGTQIGSPYYLPPEIVNNQSYDFKADVWCLGIVLYEILALEVPFSANSIAALAIRICTAEAKPVPALYGYETRSLLAKMLSKSAELRPSLDEIVGLPLIRRAIDARANGSLECTAELVHKTSKEDLHLVPHCTDNKTSDCNSSETRDTFEVLGTVGSRSLQDSRWSVDLAELERLLSSPSPVRKSKGVKSPHTLSLSPAKPLPPQYPPPSQLVHSYSGLSMSLGDLELLPRLHSNAGEEYDGVNRELTRLLGGTALGESDWIKKKSESSMVTCSSMLRNLEKDFGFT